MASKCLSHYQKRVSSTPHLVRYLPASSILSCLISYFFLLHIAPCNSQNSHYCGTDVNDANTKCQTPCPSGESSCPTGEACFLNTNCGGGSGGGISFIDIGIGGNNGNSGGAGSTEGNSPLVSTGIDAVEEALIQARQTIDEDLFLYETPMREWLPSTVYRFEGFFDGLRVMHQVGVANKKLYMGDAVTGATVRPGSSGITFGGDPSCRHCHMYGLINIAAFLAQAMKETIRYDACDENSWDRVGDLLMYPLSNACGQLGQSYQDYHCSAEEAHMECTVDPDMVITGVTHAKWYGAPGPLKCGPKSLYPFTGYWDYAYECNNPWGNPPETCTEYEGQKAGKAINDAPYPNSAGRTDVEGCCWWGRGVIQTSGICNFGKLNYYLGKRAFLEGRESRYPEIDFCRDPEAICTSQEYQELKWIAGFFYWIDQVQPYDNGGWNYMEKLHEFVDGGMQGEEFINSVSGIVNRGCHNPPCGTGELDGGPERAENFFKVLKAVDFSFVDVVKTPKPTMQPTSAPTPPPMSTQSPTLSPTTASPVALPTEVYFACGGQDGNQINGSPGSESSGADSVNLEFDYEIHNELDVTSGSALQDVKGSMLKDFASGLGCTETTSRIRRKLQSTSGNIVGFKSSRSDLPDPDAAGCLVDVETDRPTTCTPVKGAFTLYAKPGTSEASVNATANYLKSIVENSMSAGRYESDHVSKAVYIGDRNVILEGLSPPPPAPIIVKSDPPPVSDNSSLKIAIYSLGSACAVLLCALCILLPSRRKNKHTNHDEDLAVANWMQGERSDRPQYTMEHQRLKSGVENRPMHRHSAPPKSQMRKKTTKQYFENASTSDSEESDDLRNPWAVAEAALFPNHPPNGQETHYDHIASAPPIQTIGDTGQFYVQDKSPEDHLGALVVAPDPKEEGSASGSSQSSEDNMPQNRRPVPMSKSAPVGRPVGRSAKGRVQPRVQHVPNEENIDSDSSDSDTSDSESDEESHEEMNENVRYRSRSVPAIKPNGDSNPGSRRSSMDSENNNLESRHSALGSGHVKPPMRSSSQKRPQKSRGVKDKKQFSNAPPPPRRESSEVPRGTMSKEERQRRIDRARAKSARERRSSS